MIACPDPGSMVAAAKGRVITQYREAHKLLALAGAYLAHVEDAALAACAVPGSFDLDTATGDQLAIIGRLLGFPRAHCVCDASPVFGFNCDDDPNIRGFCETEEVSWANCADYQTSTLVIRDDEIYRKLLRVRCYQYLALFDRDSLAACVQEIWGSSAHIAGEGKRWVAIAPGKTLSSTESQILPIALRVLPIPAGVTIKVSYGNSPLFGFGTGYVGFCKESPKTFGFCAGFHGFCDDAVWNCPGEIEAAWFCPVTVDPYACTSEAAPTTAFGFDCDGDEDPDVSGFCAGSQTWKGC